MLLAVGVRGRGELDRGDGRERPKGSKVHRLGQVVVHERTRLARIAAAVQMAALLHLAAVRVVSSRSGLDALADENNVTRRDRLGFLLFLARRAAAAGGVSFWREKADAAYRKMLNFILKVGQRKGKGQVGKVDPSALARDPRASGAVKQCMTGHSKTQSIQCTPAIAFQ